MIGFGRFGLLIGAVAMAGLTWSLAWGGEPFTLDGVRQQVKRDYGSVSHLAPSALADARARGSDVLLLDVREAREFAVSRIPGAVRVEPGQWRSVFLRRFAEAAKGKTVVFYCSVGVRSSRLAARVQTALRAHGATAVHNLDGGIFAWHRERRPLRDAGGETTFVHPYDAHWGRLVAHRELVRRTPAERAGD